MEDLKQHYLDEMLSLSNDLQIKDYRNEKIDIHFRRECEDMIDELKEQVAILSTYPSQCFKSFCYDDDDDDDYEESYIPLREIISKLPPSIAITLVLSTLEPKDSLIMGDEHLSTIPEKESDEFIKSSVEDLVPIQKSSVESEDTSGSDSDCDLPSCDDFSPIINVYSVEDLVPIPSESEDTSGSDNHDPGSLKDEPDNLKSRVKVFNPGIHEKFFSPTYVKLPFEDHHYLSFTYVIRTVLPYFTYPVESPFLLSSGSEDTIFDPGIPVFSLKPVVSYRSGTFMIASDYEDSRARGFVHRSL
ncbi:hypothetical protein Tco_1422286, partial [Tanacetum coccineum]